MKDQPLVQRDLPYGFDALQPAMSEEQVRLHYFRNQAGYVRRANAILVQADHDMAKAPTSVWKRFTFNRSGAELHELLWGSLCPGGEAPSDRLVTVLVDLGAGSAGLDLRDAALSVEGSGWACLSYVLGRIEVHTVKDHDYPWSSHIPLVVLDVWEHAYASDWWNDRKGYVEALLPLINWRYVEDRLGWAGVL